MRETIKTAAEALDEALDKVEDIVEDTGKAAKKVATKAKRQVKAAAEKAEPVAEEVKKAVRKKATVDVYVQWDESELTINEIVEKAKADFKKDHKNAIVTCRVYVKPQEQMAYYVINDVEGKVEL